MIKTADLTPGQKKTAVTLMATAVIYLLFGFAGAPFIVRGILEKQVARAIHRQVTVGSVRVNPITLAVTLRELHIREPGGGPFVSLDEAYVNLQTSSLFKWALVLKSIRLVNPEVVLVRTGEATFNFSDMGSGNVPEAPDPEDPADAGGFALAIYDARITSGRIAINDQVASVSHRIDGLDLSLSDLSSRPADVDVTTRFHLAARINGAALSLTGKTRPFGLQRETRAEIDLESFQVPHYLPYVPLPENLTVGSLTVGAEAEIDFSMGKDHRPELVVAGLFSLRDVQLADGAGAPFVNHRQLTFDLLPSAVLTGQLRLAQVDLSGPEIFLKRLPTGELYLPFLAVKAHEKGEAAAARDATGRFQPVVTIDRLNLKQGVVRFSDRFNSDPFSTTITALDLEVDNFGLNADRTAAYRLDLKTEADESVSLSGTASLSPLTASGRLDVSGVKVSRYTPYYKDFFDFKTVGGRASLGGRYRFGRKDDAPVLTLSDVHFDLDGLKVVDEDDDEPLISIDRLRVADTTAKLDQGELTLGSLVLADAHLVCRREKDGTLNLVRAFVPPAGAKGPVAEDTAALQGKQTPQTEPTPGPLVVNLKKVNISGVTLDVEDRVPEEPVRLRLDEIVLSATDLSTAPGSTGRADLSLRWEQEGQLRAGGSVTIEPLALDLAVTMEQMDIRPFQPYLSQQAGLIVTRGVFSTEGRMALSQKRGAVPAISYSGRAGLNRFASIDRKNANDFLKWESLRFKGLTVGANPDRLSIDQIFLADFFARVIVDPDGSVNLVSMFKNPEAVEPAETGTTGKAVPASKIREIPASRAEKTPVRIARVTLSGGDVDFSDRFVKPNFNARFHDLAGSVSGLESIETKRADVLLEGMWANHAPVRITGRINPLVEDPYADLNLNISDIELSPFSPYSGKYLGHILNKGKLTFNVAYLVENRRLEGKNSLTVNQLTLGEKVDSPDAVDLPVKLAVALLKDREGNIDLDLPVSGEMDDPEFKVGTVVLTVLKNLIVKIVTSPFAALGALAGGGEELSYLDFDAGDSGIAGENAQKMDKLAKILYERPGLMLDIQGAAAPGTDSDALRAMLLENRIKAEKLKRMMKSGKSAVPLEQIALDGGERPILVEAVFAASGIPVPVDENKKPVELTPKEMETLLQTHTTVTKNDYRKLANARAFNAKNYLLEKGQVDRARIFIVEPRAETGDRKEDGTGKSRVVFSLK